MSLVLDCSVTIAWCFGDERDPASLRVLERVSAQGAVVPAIWRYEVAHVLLRAERQQRLDSTKRESLLTQLTALDIRVDPEWHLRLWTSTVRLAESHSLSVYDASYLELALRARLPLATSDKALMRAAAIEKIELV